MAQVNATILDYQEAAVEVCLHWTFFADLPKKLVGPVAASLSKTMSQPGSLQAAGSGPEAMLASLLLQVQQGQAQRGQRDQV